MNRVKTIKNDEKFLRQKSVEVNLNDIDLKKDIEILAEFCKDNDVMAMAAVQLGISKRIIYLKNTNLELINKKMFNEETEANKNYNEQKIMINPVIISKEGLTEYWEACASCLDNMGLVKRPYKIRVKYLTIDGENKDEIYEGFESTVLSHEIDHLDGILHIDIADEVIKMNQEDRKIFRQKHNYKIINKNGNYENLKNNVENQ